MNRHRNKNKIWNSVILTSLVTALILVWAVPGFAKKTQTLKAEEIHKKANDFLLQTLSWRPDQMEMSVDYKAGDLVIPEGSVDLDFQLPGRKNRVGRVPFSLLVKVDGIVRQRTRLDAEIEVIYDVIKTTQNLPRGHIITEDDIEATRVNSKRLLRNVISDPEQVVGNKVVRNLNLGETLTSFMVKRAPVVKRGDKIILIVEKGKLRITAPGMVKENGFKNAMVRVENLQTKKTVYGTVVDNRTVKVDF